VSSIFRDTSFVIKIPVPNEVEDVQFNVVNAFFIELFVHTFVLQCVQPGRVTLTFKPVE
jgi:hypothetical protein